jgi:hypothetical protein
MKKFRLSVLAVAGWFVCSVVSATTITENFSTDPLQNGWQIFGDTNLFQWDSTSQNLAVTWDSSQTNSYFYHPIGATLTKTNNFMLEFDFRLNDIAIGVDTNKPFTFQIAIGLLNFANATNEGFIVGSGYQAPNLLEFDYFPDSGFGASVTTPIISSANNFASGGFTYPLELTPGADYHAVMIYTADNQTLHSTLTSNGVPVGPLQDTKITGTFGDFNVDTISINSYSDVGQDPNYSGSVLAHGVFHSLFFANPLPVTRIDPGAPGNVQFTSTTNWLYTLERTTDLQSWTDASPVVSGIEGTLTLSDTNAPSDKAFYRVRAQRP